MPARGLDRPLKVFRIAFVVWGLLLVVDGIVWGPTWAVIFGLVILAAAFVVPAALVRWPSADPPGD